MTAQASVELVKEAVALLTDDPSKLLDRYDEFFTKDFTWASAIVGAVEGAREYRGREGFAQYWADIKAGFGEFDFDRVEVKLVDRHWVLALFHLRMRGHGSGAAVERDAGYVIGLEDGRIASGRSYLTQEEAIAAAEEKVG